MTCPGLLRTHLERYYDAMLLRRAPIVEVVNNVRNVMVNREISPDVASIVLSVRDEVKYMAEKQLSRRPDVFINGAHIQLVHKSLNKYFSEMAAGCQHLSLFTALIKDLTFDVALRETQLVRIELTWRLP
jgi:hypothetical protein